MTWELHGLAIALEGDRDGRAAALLAHFGARPTSLPTQVTLALAPDRARPCSAPVCGVHLDMTLHRDELGLHVVAPGASARLAGDRVEVHHGEAPPSLPILTAALFHLLRRYDVHALHAACVVDQGRGLLVVGPSGAGKSTLVVQLVQQGFGLVSDDSVLLQPRAEGVLALALRRGLFLRPHEAPTPPGASWRPCPLVESVKQELVLAELERVPGCLPRALLLPEVVDAPTTRLELADPAEVVWRLVAESRLVEMDREGAEAHLAPLLALAELPAWRARLGRDVRESPARVAALLREHLAPHEPLEAPAAHWSPRPDPIPSPRPQRPVTSLLGRETLVVDPVSRQTWLLDPLAAEILALEGHLDPEPAARRLARDRGLELPEARHLVTECVADLAAAGVIG